MQETINKEIRNYTESMFFGLSMRQFVVSLLACISAILTYFVATPKLGTEAASWLCIISCIPSVAFGFLKYNGMYFENIVVVILRYLVTPKKLKYKSTICIMNY